MFIDFQVIQEGGVQGLMALDEKGEIWLLENADSVDDWVNPAKEQENVWRRIRARKEV